MFLNRLIGKIQKLTFKFSLIKQFEFKAGREGDAYSMTNKKSIYSMMPK
jgi:hypothetical protein